MGSNSLHNIPRHFGVKIVERQLHQFHQEVRNEGNVYARIDVQHNPTSQKADGKLWEKEGKLGYEDKRDKAEITVANTDINHCLGKKREKHLQETA